LLLDPLDGRGDTLFVGEVGNWAKKSRKSENGDNVFYIGKKGLSPDKSWQIYM
jgi:hypothetical protein